MCLSKNVTTTISNINILDFENYSYIFQEFILFFFVYFFLFKKETIIGFSWAEISVQFPRKLLPKSLDEVRGMRDGNWQRWMIPRELQGVLGGKVSSCRVPLEASSCSSGLPPVDITPNQFHHFCQAPLRKLLHHRRTIVFSTKFW